MRWAITRVLPLPAPASTRTGPSVAVTASRWGGLTSCRTASASSTRLLVAEFGGEQSPLVRPDVHLIERPPLGVLVPQGSPGDVVRANPHHLRLQLEGA